MNAVCAQVARFARWFGLATALVCLPVLFGAAPSPAEPAAPASASSAAPPVTVRLATYNIRNYLAQDRMLDGQFKPDWPKPETEKAALRAVIRQARPDVLALEEVGDARHLEELRRDLATEGYNFPFSAIGEGPDSSRRLGLLSRLPLAQLVVYPDFPFKVAGEPQQVARGLLEATFNTNGQNWTLYIIHLKSRLTETPSDPESAIQREGEARAIRDWIRQRQALDHGALVVVAGDFNDTKDSPALRRFLELNAQPFLHPVPALDSHGETWTLYYPRADQYEHADYIFLSSALAPWQKKHGILDIPESKLASDHRLVWVDLAFPKGEAVPPAATSLLQVPTPVSANATVTAPAPVSAAP